MSSLYFSPLSEWSKGSMSSLVHRAKALTIHSVRMALFAFSLRKVTSHSMIWSSLISQVPRKVVIWDVSSSCFTFFTIVRILFMRFGRNASSVCDSVSPLLCIIPLDTNIGPVSAVRATKMDQIKIDNAAGKP